MEKAPSATDRAWQPGDIAMLTLRTGVEKPALRVEPDGEEGWVWHLLGEEFPGVAESGVAAVRRLVVIDPEQVMVDGGFNPRFVEPESLAQVLTYIARHLEDDRVPAWVGVLNALAARVLSEGVTP